MDKKRLANIFDKTKIKYPRLTIGQFKIKVQESEDINIKSTTIRYVNSYLMFNTTLPSDSFDKFLKWFKKSNKILVRKYLFKNKKRTSIQIAAVNKALNLILSFLNPRLK